jgi:hypothetical protein
VIGRRTSVARDAFLSDVQNRAYKAIRWIVNNKTEVEIHGDIDANVLCDGTGHRLKRSGDTARLHPGC